MGINKLPVFTMILHTGTYTTPHCFSRCRINTIMRGASRCEIYVSPMFRVLGRKDMIIQGTFIKIGIFHFGMDTEQTFGKFQHIVSITRLRSLTFMHIIGHIFLLRENAHPDCFRLMTKSDEKLQSPRKIQQQS